LVGCRQQNTTYNRINPTSTVHNVALVSDNIILLGLENMTIIDSIDLFQPCGLEEIIKASFYGHQRLVLVCIKARTGDLTCSLSRTGQQQDRAQWKYTV